MVAAAMYGQPKVVEWFLKRGVPVDARPPGEDLAFLVVDLGSAALALAMERGEKWGLLPWLVLQRFGYRQLMYWIVLKALAAAALGPLVGWGKLERKSTVAAVA